MKQTGHSEDFTESNMAYQEKYWHEYCDIHGDLFRISLRQWEYTGDAREVECGTEQFVVSQENSSNLLMGGLYPSKATAVFVSEPGFDLDELYTANEKTYQLARLRNGQVDWVGNVVANGFTRKNYDDDKSILTVVATDNLAVLKGIPFTDSLGENYGNDGDYIKSFLWAIKEGLKKTGMNLRIWTFCDLEPMSTIVKYSGTATLPTTSGPSSYIPLSLSAAKSLELFNIIEIGDRIRFTSGTLLNMTYTITSKIRQSSLFRYYVRLGVDQSVPLLTQESVPFEILTQIDTPNDDPLAITDHNVRVWIRDSNAEGKSYFEARGGAMMTWDVLDSIGKQWGVKIQQNQGHWEVRRWNADKLPAMGRQWFLYNSEGTFLGRQDMEQEVQIPCVATKTDYRLYGTSVKMDRVLNNVIVNYKYKYKQDGDTPKNLITNGNFENELNNWVKKQNGLSNYTKYIQVGVGDSEHPTIPKAGYVWNIMTGSYLAARNSLIYAEDKMSLLRGDKISLVFWERLTTSNSHSYDVYPSYIKGGVYQISLWAKQSHEMEGEKYDLVFDSWAKDRSTKVINGQTVVESEINCSWRNVGNEEHTKLTTFINPKDASITTWRKVILNISEVPINGYIVFEVEGACLQTNNGSLFVMNADEYFTLWTPQGNVGVNQSNTIRDKFRFYRNMPFRNGVDYSSDRLRCVFAAKGDNIGNWEATYRLHVTGVQLNRIINSNNEVVPQIDPFMYPEMSVRLHREFTDTINEIEVLTGDEYGEFVEDRISGMTVQDKPTSFWDTWDQRFGWSRQGLITAKSLIENYWKPTRLLTCEVSAKGIGFSTVFEFEEIPGKRFVILSGSIGGRYSSFAGVLKEIHDEHDISLPPGGMDGNNTTEPYWVRTGTVRCVRDEDGLNTGEVETLEINANPASSTYGQERWVPVGEDLNMCPIGDPIDILWGEQDTLDVDGLRSEPYQKTDDMYSVAYSNNNEDVYLRFLHRVSLGTVRSITYGTDYESISGWEYEPDLVIDGYIFKSIKLDWFTGIFQDVSVNFKIN